MSKATFTFGRFNPPTEVGHGKLVSAVQSHAEKTGGRHYIFPSHSQDAKKNPLTHSDKVGAMNRLFPNANVVSHGKIRTAIDAMKHLEKQGHTDVTMVVGSDRVDNFHSLLNKYRTKEFPGIKKVNVVSAGQRDPDAEGAEGMSASKLRGLVAAGKRKEFISHYSDPKLGAHIHDKVKAAMQTESTNPVGIFLLGAPGSGKDYVLNNIFSRFDLTEVQIEHILNGAAAELFESKKSIVINGALDEEKIAMASDLLEGYDLDFVYVSVTNKVSRLRNSLRENPLAENKRLEKWYRTEKLAEKVDAFNFNNSINLNESSEFEKVFFADQITKLLERVTNLGLQIQETPEPKAFSIIKEKHFPPVRKDKESGLPKKYVAGLSSSTAKARKAHWKKMSKLSDKDPRAYEPAPGDKTAKTKPSKHTLAVRKMMGEQVEGDLRKPHTVENIAKKHNVDVQVIMKALEVGKKVEKEHTKDDKTAETIALAHLWERPDYYKMLKQMEAKDVIITNKSKELDDAERYGLEKAKIKLATSKVQESDSSLAAKAKKSGVSVSTLRKVYKRGVAAWNSGHRPGTTPQQWGHARVNSYINKGKTYHTADKDLREETKISGTNCSNCIHWVKESTKPVDKSELNENGGLKPTSDAYVALSKHADLISLPGKGTVKEKAFCNHEDIQDFVTERMCCGYWDNQDAERSFKGKADIMESIDSLFEMQLVGTDEYRRHAIAMTPGQSQEIQNAYPVTNKTVRKEDCECEDTNGDCGCEDESTESRNSVNARKFSEVRAEAKEVIDKTPQLKVKRGKNTIKRPSDYNYALQGLPVTARFNALEAKEPKGFMPTPRQIPAPPGGHPVPAGYERVKSWGGGWELRKIRQKPTTVKEAVEYHIENQISFTDNVFRPGSDMFFEMIEEAKKLYKEGKYTPADEYELDMLNSDIGEIAEYEGQMVVLDYPVEEGLEECWSGYTQKGMKKKGDKMVPNCVPVNEEDKTGGKGIGKPWQEGGGGAVYVKVGDSVRKISFSKSGMKKKYMDPAATRSFVARHRCLTNKDKTSASYWACRWPRFFSNSGKIWW